MLESQRLSSILQCNLPQTKKHRLSILLWRDSFLVELLIALKRKYLRMEVKWCEDGLTSSNKYS
jgi:hypothetical protein